MENFILMCNKHILCWGQAVLSLLPQSPIIMLLRCIDINITITDLTTITKRPEMSKEIAHGTNVQLLLIILTNPHPAMCPFTSSQKEEISFSLKTPQNAQFAAVL